MILNTVSVFLQYCYYYYYHCIVYFSITIHIMYITGRTGP